MPVLSHSYAHFQAPAGNAPAAPTAVTSVTADASATVSFLPGSAGDAPVTSWTVTPYIAGSAQSPQTVGTGSATSLTGSDGNTYTQVPVTGLTNSTAYTFSVHGTSSVGAGAESSQSGANTPLSGLVFGDDFNGPAGGPVDPEWWVYDRCGYLAQSEVEWYKPDHCVLDGAGNLKLTASHDSVTGTTYPSDGNRTVTQPWTSGACQSNAKTWAPASGNTMTFEARESVMADVADGFWPGFFWLNGQSAMNWKTDPDQGGWNSTDHAEIDVAEWIPGQAGTTQYVTNTWITSSPNGNAPAPGGGYTATAMHTYAVRWKPGVSASFWRDGTQSWSTTSSIPASGCQMVLLIYLQMLAGGPTTTESCYVDYIRVYDQNLG